MVELLKKEDVTYKHDEKGNLVPVDITLVAKLPGDKDYKMVKILPMLPDELFEYSERAKLAKDNKDITSLRNIDNEIIEKHVFEPHFSAIDLKTMKPIEKQIISATVLKASGFETDINERINEIFEGVNDEEN